MGILSVIGKELVKKTGKDSSKEVAKRGGELMGRKSEKFMGMAEEVQPKRLSGPKAEEATKRGGSGKAIAAGAAAAGAAGAAALSGGKSDKESKGSEGKGRSFQDERPTRDAGRVSSKAEETKSDNKAATFGAAFKEARAAGKDTFTYEGKKYTTEMAGGKKAAEKPTGVREGRNENIDDDTRKRAMASVAKLAKGGMAVAKAPMKANCGASVPPTQKRK